jgi:hypothetical protein
MAPLGSNEVTYEKSRNNADRRIKARGANLLRSLGKQAARTTTSSWGRTKIAQFAER